MQPLVRKGAFFSLVEVAIAGLVLAAALGPLVGMMVDGRLRMSAVARRRTALALADDVLAWAVTAADAGKSGGAPMPALSGYEVAVDVEHPLPRLDMEAVTAVVSWQGRWGAEHIELKSLRVKP